MSIEHRRQDPQRRWPRIVTALVLACVAIGYFTHKDWFYSIAFLAGVVAGVIFYVTPRSNSSR